MIKRDPTIEQWRTWNAISDVLNGTRRIDQSGVPELDALNAIADAAMRIDPQQLHRATPETDQRQRIAVLRTAACQIAESLCAACGLKPGVYGDDLVAIAFSSHDPRDVP